MYVCMYRDMHTLQPYNVSVSLLYGNIAGYVLLLSTTVNFTLSSNTSLIFAEQIFTILEKKFWWLMKDVCVLFSTD